jgi:hypothetical protein
MRLIAKITHTTPYINKKINIIKVIIVSGSEKIQTNGDTCVIIPTTIIAANNPRTKTKNPITPKSVHTYSRLDILYIKISLKPSQSSML